MLAVRKLARFTARPALPLIDFQGSLVTPGAGLRQVRGLGERAVWHRKDWLSPLLCVAVCTAMMFGGAPCANAQAPAQGGILGGYMELSTVADGSGGFVYGPGQIVAIDGVIPFVYNGTCQSMIDKGKYPKPLIQIYPVADFYVMKDDGTALSYGTALKDINGTPNTIIGLSDGSFVDEIVAITMPAGNTGAGKYRIVMDACQTGVFEPGVDIVLGDASQLGFIVQEPAVLPPLDLSPIKTSASEYVSVLSDTKIGPSGAQITIPGGCSLYKKLGKNVPAATLLAGWFQTSLTYCADLIGHYQGLAADPPDPNYKVFAELGTIGYGSFSASTPLERAARTLANALADQDAASNAFLNSIQKFQGAQQAGDDEWSLLQLMQTNKFINLLVGPGGSMLRTYAALEAFNIALQKDPLGTTQDAQNFEAFLPTLRQALGAMLTPLGGFFQPYYDPSTGGKLLRPVGLQAFIEVYLGLFPLPGELPGIPQERALAGLPPIVLPYPTANTGGNYNAAPGATITFNAGSSTDPGAGSLTYAWDLNGNGTFTDATGAQPQYSYSQPGTRTIGVQVTDSSGFTNVAYALVNIGDVNSQDIITQSGSDQIFDVHADGSFSQLTPGVPYFDTLRKLKVDVNGDIWELGGNNGFGINGTYGGSLHHFDSQGNLLATITPAQLGTLTGLSLVSIDDFDMDGSGRIDLTATEDLGPGCYDTALSVCTGHVPGPGVLIRMAPDASSAAFLVEVETRNFSVQMVNGVLVATEQGCAGLYGAGFVRVDPNNGNILVSNVNGGDPTRCDFGVFSIDPTTAAFTEVIPAGSPGVVSDPTYGMYYSTDFTFGGSTLHWGSYGGIAPQEPGLFAVDAQGNYVIAPIQAAGGGFIGRVDVPPQITNIGLILDVEAFPVITHSLGTPFVILNSMTVDAGGDYVGVGINYAVSFAPLIFRITPDGQIFTVSTALSPATGLSLVDVVPQIRAVAPSDMPAPPAVTLSHLTVGQNSCPGSAQLSVTLKNTGSLPTPLPVEVIFFDGDPGLGVAVGIATTGGPVPAGGSVTMTAPWAMPSAGSHSVFAMALGANTINVDFDVCVPSQYSTNPLVLSPPSGSNGTGTTHMVAAQLVDILGGGVSGAPITFTVSGANTTTGTISTDANGNAVFSYSGTNAGQDSIVATINQGGMSVLTSNTVAETWTSSVPPVVTPPASISIPATEAGGARGSAWPLLAAFLAGGTAVDIADPSPKRLTPQVGGAAADNTTLFPVGTTTVTFRFQDASGNIGTANATVTVVIGTPRITGSIARVGADPSGAIYADVVLSNTGTGNARNLRINSLLFRTLSGTGTVMYNSALSPPIPITIGNLDVGTAMTTRVFLNVPSSATRIAVTETGPVQDVLGTNYSFSTSEAFVP